ncbi:MAG TPA: hypothetical protein VE978_22625 [Chitinophagales bacterium]|nr:hypothetical protein [Chitinophagales bacterium]
MLVPWLLLMLIVTGHLFAKYGWLYLFLDPEYFGKVNFLSFFIVGVGLGGFIFVWNITSYILNSFRFPFLAAFESPFLRYSINNAVIPLIFIIIYFASLIEFQYYDELKSFFEVLAYQGALICGMLMMLMTTSFRYLNIHVEKLAERSQRQKANKPNRVFRKWWFEGKETSPLPHELRVDYVLIHPFRVRHVRDVKHYPMNELMKVFRLHHKNALIIESMALLLIIALGFLMEVPFFQIPAAASILLMLSILLAPIGALSFWLKTWAATAFIALILLVNLLAKFDFISHDSRAYGWDYNKRTEYTRGNIERIMTPQQVEHDRQAGLEMLRNWKRKVSSYYDPLQKPPLIIVNASGGGLKASLWAFRLMQIADSITHNRFFDHVEFISGASGGMMGEAYYRELYLHRELGDSINLQDEKYVNNISKDILNAVSFTYVVNDLLFPWQGLDIGNLKYRKDRGYEFERRLNQNTSYIMDKRVKDYSFAERNGYSPLMLLSPTIIADGRRLLISSQPVSYLAQPTDRMHSSNPLKVDGIDANLFFRKQGGPNLLYLSAIRMNATFPYIMPNVYLPTNPSAQCMDAGMRDNYGAEPAMRFLYTFKDWINVNCSRVIIIQARGDFEKNYEPIVEAHPSLVHKVLDPINSLYYNWSDYHDYTGDEEFSMAKSWLNVDLNLFSFEYKPEKKNEVASMSLHLTTREKQSILSTMENPLNRNKLSELAALLSQ